MEYNIKYIDVPGFRISGRIELPNDIVPFKTDYVVETASGAINIYDSIEELKKLLYSKEYKTIEPNMVIVPENNSLKQYKISIRFYYLEKC